MQPTPPLPATPPNPPKSPKKPRKVGAAPERDQAQAAVWLAMAATWKKNPAFTLAYTTQADFAAAATAQATKLKIRLDVDDPRRLFSNRLDTISGLFAAALPYIKAALLPIFEKEGLEAAYPGFGIGRYNGKWQFSGDRLAQQDEYDTCVAGLLAQKLTKGKYGSDTLGPLAQEFRATYALLVALDEDTSKAVGNKNQGKPYLTKVARSLRLLVEANFPDTHAQELRAWGVQKEKF